LLGGVALSTVAARAAGGATGGTKIRLDEDSFATLID
jgi:hypothetical protein